MASNKMNGGGSVASNNTASTGGNGEEYLVEKILDKKIERGITLYLIKWEGYGPQDNTWEPKKHLTPHLIAEFEGARINQAPTLQPATHEPTDSDSPPPSPPRKIKAPRIEERRNGFERGLKPVKIIGITDEFEEIKFLIKFEGSEEAELVPTRIANAKCPKLVIEFYEKRLIWHNDDEEEEPTQEQDI